MIEVVERNRSARGWKKSIFRECLRKIMVNPAHKDADCNARGNILPQVRSPMQRVYGMKMIPSGVYGMTNLSIECKGR